MQYIVCLQDRSFSVILKIEGCKYVAYFAVFFFGENKTHVCCNIHLYWQKRTWGRHKIQQILLWYKSLINPVSSLIRLTNVLRTHNMCCRYIIIILILHHDWFHDNELGTCVNLRIHVGAGDQVALLIHMIVSSLGFSSTKPCWHSYVMFCMYVIPEEAEMYPWSTSGAKPQHLAVNIKHSHIIYYNYMVIQMVIKNTR